MAKLDISKVFDAMCDSVLHELSTKALIRERDEHNKIMPLLTFLQEERKSRGLHPMDFRVKVGELVYGWNEWNSGGGCMIWSVEFTDGKSMHLSDEYICVSTKGTKEYWEIEDCDEQSDTHVFSKWMSPDNYDFYDWAFMLCPIFGQEMADALNKDIKMILEII